MIYFFGSGEDDFTCFYHIYGHGAHLVQLREPFQQIGNTLLTEGPM